MFSAHALHTDENVTMRVSQLFLPTLNALLAAAAFFSAIRCHA
jgi:hypothetical protein